jgi:hypothetical protein
MRPLTTTPKAAGRHPFLRFCSFRGAGFSRIWKGSGLEGFDTIMYGLTHSAFRNGLQKQDIGPESRIAYKLLWLWDLYAFISD